MNETRDLRRFSAGQILLHWVNALPYLVLMTTGLLLLLARALDVHPLPPALLARVHRIAGAVLVGILLQAVILGLAAPAFRSLYHSLGHALLWRGHDLHWLLKVPLNLVSHRIGLPPAGWFNAGQKLHLLAVAGALTGLSVTGLIMWLAPGRIWPWVVHLVCFALAAGFLGLHLFLSLVNPETRRSLPTIFTGRADPTYVRTHHARWLGVEPIAHARRYVSPRAVLLAGAVVLGLLAWGVRAYGPGPLRARAQDLWQRRGTPLILPGPLSRAHADDPNCAACTACHRGGGLPVDAACRECHEPVAERLAAQTGFHGTLTGPCRSCHAEHRGVDANLIDLEAVGFSHDRSAFLLEGAHRDVDCAHCHAPDPCRPEALRFLGVVYETCTDCHEHPHGETLHGTCTDCHGLDTWDGKGLRFDHERDTDFGLDGKHARARCDKCHNPERRPHTFLLGELPRACADCHERSPHRFAAPEDCAPCHRPAGWGRKQLRFDHERDTDFPLDGKHREARCQACHNPQRERKTFLLAGVGQACADCHEDPHAGRLGTHCETCHTDRGWEGTALHFAHDLDTDFPLDGLHRPLACAACHTTPDHRFAAAGTQCVDCHRLEVQALAGTLEDLNAGPDPHDGRVTCTECHAIDRPHQSAADYADRCADCHTAAYRGLYYDWQRLLHERGTGRLRRIGLHNLSQLQQTLGATVPPAAAESRP